MTKFPYQISLLSKKYISLIILAVLCFIWGIPEAAQAAAGDTGHKTVYMVVVDKLSVNDISASATPVINELVHQGAIGLASNRTLRSHNTVDSSLTLGAGNLARAYENNLMGFNSDEAVPEYKQTAAQLYNHLTGIDSSSGACLLLNLPEILTGMGLEKVNTVPGAMGENLRLHNLKVCVLGNGDTDKEMLRSGIAIGMDARGQVALGDVGPKTYVESTDSFLSLETDYSYLQERLKEYHQQADCMIIDLSDLARLETANIPMVDIGLAQRQLRLRKIDNFINEVKKEMNPAKDLLLIISTSPAREQMLINNSFTIVIAYGKGFQRSFLSSATTRRNYIIANTDIAPTVLNFFGLKDENRTMIGQPLLATAAGKQDTLQGAQELADKSSTVSRLRAPLIKGYVVLQIIIILLSLIVIFYNKKLAHLLEPLIILVVAVPLVLLVLGKIDLPYDWLYIIAAILASVFLTAVSLFCCKGKGFKAFMLISTMTIILLNIDVLTGSSLIQSSVLGYDPMSGARYYGIGNEFMGILVGSIIAVAAAIYDEYKRPWLLGLTGIAFLSQCYLIAGPSLGANSDGILTAPAAFLVSFVLLADIRIRPRHLVYIGGIIAAGILGLSYYDMHRPVELQSHIGRAANLIAAGGWQEGWTIVSRKLGMNLKLIRYTIWSWVFIVILIVLSLLVYRPVGAMRQLMQERPYIVKGFAGILTGALVGLAVNDSGIVAAATTSIYLVVPILILMLHLKENATESLPIAIVDGREEDER